MQRVQIPAILLLMSFATPALADERIVPPQCTRLGTVHIAKPHKGLDVHARKSLDTLIPKIRKTGEGKLIWIEGNDSEATTENRLTNSFNLARNVQTYLAPRLNFDHDIYLNAALDNNSPDRTGTVRIFICPKQFNEDTIELTRNLTENIDDGALSASGR